MPRAVDRLMHAGDLAGRARSGTASSTSRSAMIGSIFSSLTDSNSTPRPLPTIISDSRRPMCLILPASTAARNSSGVMPAPTLRCSGSRRVDAFWMRMISTDSTLLADRGDRQRQLVHDEAGIHAGAEERDVLRARDLLQLFADLDVERERELFARRDDVAAALEQHPSSWPETSRRREPVEWQTTSGLSCQLARDLDADFAIEADHFAEVLADLVRIDVDRGDELEPRLGQQQPRDLRADRTDSVLRDCDGLNRFMARAL